MLCLIILEIDLIKVSRIVASGYCFDEIAKWCNVCQRGKYEEGQRENMSKCIFLRTCTKIKFLCSSKLLMYESNSHHQSTKYSAIVSVFFNCMLLGKFS